MGATVLAATQIGRFAVALGLGATVLTGWAPTGWADATDTTDNTSKSADPSSQAGADEDPSTEPTQAVTGTAEPSRTVEPEPTAAEDTAEPIAPTADTEDDNEAPDSQDPERTNSRAAAPAKTLKVIETDDAAPRAVPDIDAPEPADDDESVPAETAADRAAPAATVAVRFAEPAADPVAPTAPDRVVETVATATSLTSPLAQPDGGDDVPGAATGLWAMLAFARREFDSFFFNSHPVAAPVITSQTDDQAVGTFGATDADGDALTYTILGRGPALGRVSIDQATGTFTYTPVVDFSTLGGSDSFTVEVSDGSRLHGLDSLWEIPVNFIRGIPFLGSLLSDFLPRTSPTVTVTINFTGTGDLTDLVFPDGFHWGVATSGFQSEMGGGAPLDVNSDWWQWLHDPVNKLLLGWHSDALPENGPGTYLTYASDAQLAADEVGADTFRMGIEWSRIFPNSTAAVDISGGFTDAVLQQLDALADQDAVAHYANVLATLHALGLEPMVTINHFTLPLWVHDPSRARLEEIFGGTPEEQGGWVSDSTVAEFEKYTAYLAWKYGDQVTDWIVLNEPMNSMMPAYYGIPFGTGFPSGVFRPDLMAKGLLNQAAAYSGSYDIIHQLDEDANVGAALSMFDWRPENATSAIDQQAAVQFSDFFNTWFPNAVIRGEVDANFDGVIAADEIHPELANKADFFGVNYYGQGSVIGWGGSPFASMPLLTGYPQFANLINVLVGGCPAEECSDAPTVIKPSGMRDMLDIAASYGIPLWITENGLADATDTQRSSYLVRHLAVVNKAINDGVDIRGYISWSLLDNLEWILGYGEKFGLYSWDPVTLERTARSTVAVLNQITTTNSIPAELFQQYVKATGSLP